MNSWTVDRKIIGKAVVEFTRLSLDMAQEHMNNCPNLKVIHVRYQDTIKNAKQTCEKVCGETDLPFSEEYIHKVDNYLDASDKKRKEMAKKGLGGAMGKLHDYSLEDYGLSEKEVAEMFEDYIKKYDL
jgi:hypothetical protein